ncbi:hypothetical protein AVEN_264770-1 [Araneus ventricosus]|uniref:Uncharacterized protein n=1 Tax=Araneus ventricosus TaxID=182803 RepID=A0A4Y2EGC5_ARAVE|nr:hypothetical protein AVEN_264770-1 [Araneus ventricosus]
MTVEKAVFLLSPVAVFRTGVRGGRLVLQVAEGASKSIRHTSHYKADIEGPQNNFAPVATFCQNPPLVVAGVMIDEDLQKFSESRVMRTTAIGRLPIRNLPKSTDSSRFKES